MFTVAKNSRKNSGSWDVICHFVPRLLSRINIQFIVKELNETQEK